MLVPDEMLGVSSGLGYFILDTRDRFRYDQLMAAILLIGLLGFLLDSVVKIIQRRYSWTTE
jgi:NitT/TauT family transport system permease protein